MESTLGLILGGVIFLAGAYFRYRLKRRKYHRRAQPVQRVSYKRRFISGMSGELLQFLSYLFLLTGIATLFFGLYIHREMKQIKDDQSTTQTKKKE